MIKSSKAKVALIGALALALVGTSAGVATAATPAGSADPIYLIDGNTGLPLAEGSTIAWDAPIVASPVVDNLDAQYTGPAEATGVRIFLSPINSETTVGSWTANAPGAFFPGTTNVLTPQISPNSLINGNAAGAKAAGGDYSLGFAFTSNNGVTVLKAVYTYVHITAVTGAFTWDYPTGVAEPDPCVVDPSSCQTGDIDLEATIIGAEDGALQLTVPAAAKATFGAATLVNQLSTSTATLPEVTVSDARVVTRPGWTLTHSVANFVAGANTIEAKHLGVAPKIVAAGTTSTSATAAAEQVAGSAVFPAGFAEAVAGPESLGVTKLSADLKLVAPADAPAGTYTSKMTLTLVSK